MVAQHDFETLWLCNFFHSMPNTQWTYIDGAWWLNTTSKPCGSAASSMACPYASVDLFRRARSGCLESPTACEVPGACAEHPKQSTARLVQTLVASPTARAWGPIASVGSAGLQSHIAPSAGSAVWSIALLRIEIWTAEGVDDGLSGHRCCHHQQDGARAPHDERS